MEMDSKVILSIIGSLFATYFWFYNNTKTNLQQNLYRKNKINILTTHNFEKTYKTNLQALISWLDNIYNNSTLIQNYSRHVTIALIYTLMVFLLFWVLGAEGRIGSLEVLKKTTIEIRIKTFFFTTLHILLMYFFYKKTNFIIDYFIKKFPNKFKKNYIIKSMITILVGIGIITVISIGLEIILEGILSGANKIIIIVGLGIIIGSFIKKFYQRILIFILIYLSMTLTQTGGFEEALNLTFIYMIVSLPIIFSIKKLGLGINLISFSFLIFIIDNGNASIVNANSYIIGLFLIVLPLTNSLLDYVSLKISKYMSEQIIADHSVLTMLLHLLADIIIAIIFLLGLALFLYSSVAGLNMFINTPIPMKEMLVATSNDPFCVENGWITFMLLSTLVPTMVHLVLALGALFIAIMPSEQSLKELKMYNKGQEALLESAAHYFTRIAFMQTFFSFVVLILLSLPFWYDKL